MCYVKIDKKKAYAKHHIKVSLSFCFVQVLPILMNVIGNIFVDFQQLNIYIHKGAYTSWRQNIALGNTLNQHSSAEVYLYLKHHESDIHFLGILLHELGHCLVNT
jgi:hypothetical protein